MVMHLGFENTLQICQKVPGGGGKKGLQVLTVGLAKCKYALWFILALGCATSTLRVQVPNNHILAQNLYYNSYYPNPKYPIIGYLDP